MTQLRSEIYDLLFKRLFSMYKASFSIIARNSQHIYQMAKDSLDPSRSLEQLRVFEKLSGKLIRGNRLLEIGSGVGLTLVMARLKYGADSFGVEADSAEYEGTLNFSSDLLYAYDLPRCLVQGAVGEELPFQDESFDIVISSNVLEHVRNCQKVIDEAIRVLKIGGIMQMVVPNYGSWWEGHYGILWLPNMPKPLGKLYVWLCGRDPAFLEHINLLNRKWLEQILRKHRDKIEILGWGENVWEDRVRTLEFSEWAVLKRMKSILDLIHGVGITELVIRLGKKLHWETPFILTILKKG